VRRMLDAAFEEAGLKGSAAEPVDER